jgi:hypothetical protein
MKTYKNIFPRICAYDNLYFAWRDAARGKRKSPEVAAFEYALIDKKKKDSAVRSRSRA